jgi:hypothetical protein
LSDQKEIWYTGATISSLEATKYLCKTDILLVFLSRASTLKKTGAQTKNFAVDVLQNRKKNIIW